MKIHKNLPKEITIGDKYALCLLIETQEEADQYFEELVKHNMLFGIPRERAEELERKSVGYYAGYTCDEQLFKRTIKLFKTTHPIFGDNWPTPKEAYKMGMSWARQMKDKQS